MDIARQWDAYRRDRLARHTDPLPVGDPDDVTAYLSELRGNRRAVAVGETAPSTLHELTAGPHPDVEARLRSVGSVIPPAVRAQLAPYRSSRAGREAVTAAAPTRQSAPPRPTTGVAGGIGTPPSGPARPSRR